VRGAGPIHRRRHTRTLQSSSRHARVEQCRPCQSTILTSMSRWPRHALGCRWAGCDSRAGGGDTGFQFTRWRTSVSIRESRTDGEAMGSDDASLIHHSRTLLAAKDRFVRHRGGDPGSRRGTGCWPSRVLRNSPQKSLVVLKDGLLVISRGGLATTATRQAERLQPFC